MKKVIAAIALLFATTLGMTACSSPVPTVEVSSETTIIDVRTPAEFAEGHLEGAVNIDVQSPSFASTISSLPADGEYVVYCRSGNRSAQAISQMNQMGFTNLTDAGSVQEASDATGIPVVK